MMINKTKKFFFNVVSRYFSVDFRNVSFYLQAFSHFIPLSLVNQVSKYTYLTKSVVVLHYIVKIYERVFDPRKAQFVKHADYVTVFAQLESELNSIIKESSFLNNLSQFFIKNKLGEYIVLISATSLSGIIVAVGIPPDPDILKRGLNPIPGPPNVTPLKPKLPPNVTPLKPRLPTNKSQLKRQQQQEKLLIDNKLKRMQEARNYDPILREQYLSDPNFQFESVEDQGLPAIFVDRTRQIIAQFGRSDSYDVLLSDRDGFQKIKDSLYPNYSEIALSDQDHLVNKVMRAITRLPKNKSRAITSTRKMNQGRENAKGGQKLFCEPEDLLNLSVNEVSSILLRESNDKMVVYMEQSEKTKSISFF